MNASHPTPDATWQRLHRYATRGCEVSFRELFESHAGLVYHAALRVGRGDRALAEEVVQTVFADLARKARGFSPRIILPAWLHRHACLTTLQMLRSSRRRRSRERAVAEEESHRTERPPAGGSDPELRDHLDAALNALPATDRQVLILRFLEERDFRDIGRRLGISDDAAQKRATRGLERLRAVLARRGVAVTATAAGAALGLPAAAVPAGVLPAVMASLPAAAGSVGTATLASAGAGLALFTMKPVMLAAVAALLAVTGVVVLPMILSKSARPVTRLSPLGTEASPSAPDRPMPASFRAAMAEAEAIRRHFPTLAGSPRASVPAEEEQYKAAFQAHPRTRIAEARVNALLQAHKALLERWTDEYRVKTQKRMLAEARSQDADLSEAERAAATAESQALQTQADEIKRDRIDMTGEMDAFLQRIVRTDRASILEEIKNPPPPSAAKTMTAQSEAALRVADDLFARGDYQAVANTLAPVLETLPEAERVSAQWKALLSRMITGQDTAPTIEPLLHATTSPAFYALAAYAIQQGAWDDAQHWLDHAATAGDRQENAAFNHALIHLGWMDAETGRLIPPPE